MLEVYHKFESFIYENEFFEGKKIFIWMRDFIHEAKEENLFDDLISKYHIYNEPERTFNNEEENLSVNAFVQGDSLKFSVEEKRKPMRRKIKRKREKLKKKKNFLSWV
jgi:hypothetical protein